MRKRFQIKSYFWEVFTNTILTLSVLIVVIFLLYFQAEATIKEQILISNQNILSQFFELIDKTTEEMVAKELSISSNKECMNYANYVVNAPNKTAVQIVNVKKELADLWDEKYHDIFVYYPNQDRIVSANNASLKTEYYIQTYYNDSEYDYEEEFHRILESQDKRPTFYTMNKEGDTPYLCLAMRQMNKNTKLDYVIVIVLDTEYLEQLMCGEGTGQNGTVLIFNHNKELLVSGDKQKGSYYLKEDNVLETLHESIFEMDKAMIQVQKSRYVDVYYAFATPYEYFWERLTKMRTVSGICGFICVCASFILAYRNTKKSYKPIGKMIHRIQEKNKEFYDEKVINEFEFIEKILENEKQKNHIMNSRLEKNKDIRKDHFLLSVITGKISAEEEESGNLEESGIVLCSDKFQIAIVSVIQRQERNLDIEEFIIKNLFEELCNRICPSYVVRVSENRYVVLINLRKESDAESIMLSLGEGQELLEKYKYNISIGIGGVKEGLMLVRQSYQEALQALKYTYVLGENNIITYNEIQDREFCYLTGIENKLFGKITDFIKGDMLPKTSEQVATEILEECGIDETAAMETIEYFQYELLGVINKVMMHCDSQIENRGVLIRELMAQPTLLQFKTKFIFLLNLLHEDKQVSKDVEDICGRAVLYIEEHYMEPQLSVSRLGEELEVSSVYLSKVFKEQYGITILNYIAQTRVQKSKKALQDKNKSIKQISEEHGFLSSNVFIKTFKKWEGITPGMYRELN